MTHWLRPVLRNVYNHTWFVSIFIAYTRWLLCNLFFFYFNVCIKILNSRLTTFPITPIYLTTSDIRVFCDTRARKRKRAQRRTSGNRVYTEACAPRMRLNDPVEDSPFYASRRYINERFPLLINCCTRNGEEKIKPSLLCRVFIIIFFFFHLLVVIKIYTGTVVASRCL